jgi:hypothetical protein
MRNTMSALTWFVGIFHADSFPIPWGAGIVNQDDDQRRAGGGDNAGAMVATMGDTANIQGAG